MSVISNLSPQSHGCMDRPRPCWQHVLSISRTNYSLHHHISGAELCISLHQPGAESRLLKSAPTSPHTIWLICITAARWGFHQNPWFFFFFSWHIFKSWCSLSSWRQVAASGQSPGLWLTGTNYCSSFYHFYLSILTFYCFPLFFFLFLFLLLFPSSIFFSSPFFLLFFLSSSSSECYF